MIADHTAAPRAEADALYADVIVPRHLAGPFTYRVPRALRPILRVGHLVLVPFGRSVIQGAVIALAETHPPAVARERVREIRTLVSDGQTAEIPSNLLQLAKQVAEAYVAPWGQCLRLILPPVGSRQTDTSRFLLTKPGTEALAAKTIKSPDVLNLLRRLKRRPLGVKAATLRGGQDQSQQDLLTSLVEQGLVQEIHESTASRGRGSVIPPAEHDRGLYHAETHSTKNVSCYPLEWEGRIVYALEKRQAVRLLIQAPAPERFGLLRYAMSQTINLGRTVLVIVGEAERAESIAAALAQDATIATACLHSGVPDNRKAEMWERIRQQHIQVVVGTRSAVFLPLQSVGLIWIEREEDPALKEPQEPRYHAREVAWLRARDEQALLVIASGHLCLETVMGFEQQECVLQMPVWRAGEPKIEVVDLRGEERGTILSSQLVEAMREALARQAGVLLFLNRKGYAGALICRDCGQVPRCPSCQVAFAYYRHKGALICSYCGTTNAIPDCCPSCAGHRLQLIGEGTERVEEEVRRLFPRAKVLRVDGETMRRPKQATALRSRIQQREWEVLVGTQLLLRDDVVPGAGLVGVVQADAGLSLPDFRAAERAYHLLIDAVSLAQPSSLGGRTILQSFLPSHHAIQAVVQQDEAIFRSEELLHRTALGYPPALYLTVLHISGSQEKTVEQAALAWVARLSPSPVKMTAGAGSAAHGNVVDQSDGMVILGPVPAPVPKLRGRYRRQILIKSHSRAAAVEAVRTTVSELEKVYPSRTVKFDVDVDPLEMW
ncbi:MAG TPA: primosomal protein N' [Nitrospira sp.]|nr:primosomal protein N' [Nitrospira sp.]